MPPRIHIVFHVSLLKWASTDPFPSQAQDDSQPLPAVVSEEGDEWEVQEILKARNHSKQVLVKWFRYTKLTWEPTEELKDTTALQRFEERQKEEEESDVIG